LHIEDGGAERGVRLDLALGKLRLHPVFERCHALLAFVLVQLQPLRGVEAPVTGSGIGDVHLAQRLEDEADFVGEAFQQFHVLAAGMGHA
jgi:hypothetical protein